MISVFRHPEIIRFYCLFWDSVETEPNCCQLLIAANSMRISKKIFVIGLFLMWAFKGYAQQQGTYHDVAVEVLRIVDSTLGAKLDSFIEFEKTCEYYSSDLIVGISIQTWVNGYYITIGSDDRLGEASNDSLIYGGLLCKGHYVDVGIHPDVPDLLKELLFEKTDERKKIKRYQAFNGYDSNTGIVVLESGEDDSFSYWRYFYQKGVFKLYERHTYCE